LCINTSVFQYFIMSKNQHMYIIAVYDCGEKRVVKMLKLMRRYLNWIQNSVFEGELTEVQVKQLKIEAEKIMNKQEDSLIIFSSRDSKWLEKEVLGLEKNNLDNFL
jgi:CRISPR-associated protein Cas2